MTEPPPRANPVPTPVNEYLDAAASPSPVNSSPVNPTPAGRPPRDDSSTDRGSIRPPVADSTRLHDAILLGVAVFVWVLAAALVVRPDQTVAFWFTPEEPLPESCLTRAALGVSCPACGLTRSFVHLAQGRWQASFDRHPLGWLMALLVLFQIPYRSAALLGWRVWRPSEKLFSRSALALGCVFLVVWITRAAVNWVIAARV